VVTPLSVKVKREDVDDTNVESIDGFASASAGSKSALPEETKVEIVTSMGGGNPGTSNGKVKSEEFGYDTDEYSRFSEGSAFKDERGEEEAEKEVKEESGVSNSNDDLEAESKEDDNSAVVKEEPTYEKLKAKNPRKYGDRVLLARQSKDGMMKLGGGNQSSDLYPKDDEERMSRMDGRYAMAYNCQWNL
jgi:hypothetical protein